MNTSAGRRTARWWRPTIASLPTQLWAPLLIHSRRTLAWHALLVAVAFFWFQTGLQWLIYTHEVHWVTGALSSLCIGALSFWLFDGVHKRRMAHKARFEAIGEANHHIRNALTAIQFRFLQAQVDPQQMEEMMEAVNRICWVLDEVLPEEKH